MVVSANNSGAIWQFCNKSENKQLKKNEQEGIRKDAKCTEPRKQARDHRPGEQTGTTSVPDELSTNQRDATPAS